jgi:hypothetical protein
MAVETINDDLAYCVKLLSEMHGLSPARVELSVREDGIVVAQIMADRLPIPLTGMGTDAPEALRELVVVTEEQIRRGARRRRRRPRVRSADAEGRSSGAGARAPRQGEDER